MLAGLCSFLELKVFFSGNVDVGSIQFRGDARGVFTFLGVSEGLLEAAHRPCHNVVIWFFKAVGKDL